MLAKHLVGRADELGSLKQVLTELDQGRPGAVEVVGEPGIGKTRLLTELAARAEQRGHLVLSGSASELERDLPFSVFVDALDEYVESLEPQLARGARRRRPSRARARLPVAVGARGRPRGGAPARALSQPSRRARAARAARGRQGRSCSCSTTSTGPTRRRSSCSARCCAGRRPQPVLIALARRPRQDAGASRAALERAHRAAALTRIELGALTPDEARELLGGERRRRRRNRPLRGERRQPVLSRAARPVARARGLQPLRCRDRAERHRGPVRGRGLAERRARVAVGRRTPRARRRGGGGRSVRARAGRGRRSDVRGCGDGRGRRAPAVRSRSHDRRAAALSLPAPARPAGGLRGHRRRLAAWGPRAVRRGARGARCGGSGARPPRRAVGAPGRRRRRRRPARGGRGSRSARARKRCAVVRGGAAAAPADRAGAGARRAPARPCRGAGGGGPFRRQP